MVETTLLRKLDPERYRLLTKAKIVWRKSKGRRYASVGIKKEVRPYLIVDGMTHLAFFLDMKTGLVVVLPLKGDGDGRD